MDVKGLDFVQLERACQESGREYARRLMKEKLESYDEELKKNRNTDKESVYYKDLGKRKITYLTLIGPVEVNRTYYSVVNRVSGETTNTFLLDAAIGKGIVGRTSSNLVSLSAAMVSDSSCRGVAKNLSLLSGQKIGHMSVYKWARHMAVKIEVVQEKRLKPKNRAEKRLAQFYNDNE